MKKQINPLQNLIDEMNQNKKVHAQLAKNAENERNRYNDNYVHFEQGVAYGFELAIEIVAKFNFWNNAITNPPKFDKNRQYPYMASFLCIVKKNNGQYVISEKVYNFTENKWLYTEAEILYWQEYPVIPKELLK